MVGGLLGEGRGPTPLANIGTKPHFLCPGCTQTTEPWGTLGKGLFSPLIKARKRREAGCSRSQNLLVVGPVLSEELAYQSARRNGFLPPTHGCMGARGHLSSLFACSFVCRGGSMVLGCRGGGESFSLCTVLVAFFKNAM